MFRHFTFLFQIREGQQEKHMKEHIILCNRVLDIFLQLGMHGDIMEEETWNNLLLIILGTADYTLRGKKGIPDLNYPILKVLFELWICSLSYDKVMWGYFQTYAVQWGKHIATIKQWDAVCYGLTQKVINLIYGPTEGTANVKIKWEGIKECPNQNVATEITELDLPDEYVYFIWYVVLYIIGNPNKLLDPEIHLRAFQGLQRISKCFVTIGREPVNDAVKKKEGIDWKSLPYAPDGNTILDIFSAWLFEAVNRKLNVFNEGRAVAYASLCKIFCRKGGKPFSKEHLSLFYKAILNGLKEDEELIIISSIMLNSCKIFSYELEGSHILIPRYMEVCEKVLRVPKGKPNPYPANLHSACITLASSLISLPNRYAGVELKEPLYRDLKNQLYDLLEKALICEKTPKNIQHILWSICVFIYEERNNDQKISVSFISSMLDLLKTYGHQSKEISHEVFVSLFEVLSSLTPLYTTLMKGNDKIGTFIIDELTNYVADGLRHLPNEKQLTILISECIYCMVDWLMVAHEIIMSNNFIIVNLLARIEGCLNLMKHNFPNHDIDEIKKAAHYILSHLFNFVGNNPPTSDISVQSSALLYEDDTVLDDGNLEDSNYARFFMFDDQFLFTVIEQPNEKKNGPGVTVIVRDITGKFVWDSIQLFGSPEKTPEEFLKFGKYTGSTGEGLTDHTKEHDTNKTIMEFSTERKIKTKDDLDKYLALIDTQEENENGYYLDLVPAFKEVDISVKPMKMKPKYDSLCKFQISRLLLSQLGYFSFGVTDKKRFYQLQNNNRLILNLKALDGCSERECHKIGVVYVKEGVDNQNEIFEMNQTSDRFSQYCDSLGWKVPLSKHTGFTGGLDKISLSTGEYTPYFADYKSEIIFHIPSLMPTSKTDPQQIHKKRHIGNDHVKIIWSEHTREWYKETITSHFNLFQIVIYPLKNGLFRIEILKKEDNIDCGPLYDGMIVGEHIIGILSRITAVNANKIVRKNTTGYQRPHAKRQALISDVATRCKTELPINSYYSCLFFSKAETIKQVESKNAYKPQKKK